MTNLKQISTSKSQQPAPGIRSPAFAWHPPGWPRDGAAAAAKVRGGCFLGRASVCEARFNLRTSVPVGGDIESAKSCFAFHADRPYWLDQLFSEHDVSDVGGAFYNRRRALSTGGGRRVERQVKSQISNYKSQTNSNYQITNGRVSRAESHKEHEKSRK